MSLLKVIEEMLRLSKVDEGEKVVLLTSHCLDETFVNYCLMAIDNLKANSVRIVWRPPIAGTNRIGPTTQILKGEGLVLHVQTVWPIPKRYPPFYSDESNEILASGARWLDLLMPLPEINVPRLFPTETVRKRTISGAEIMEKAKTVRITSESGTDLTMDRSGRKVVRMIGCADEPGLGEAYGFAQVATTALEDSANGTLVMEPGDYILGIYLDVIDRVKCTFKDGRITKIDGGYTAGILDRWLAQWNDPESYGIAHIGWGTHENAIWRNQRITTGPDIFTFPDAESYMGMIQLAVGTNIWDTPTRWGLGGKNRARSHCDIEVLNHNLYLDDELIVKNGKIVHPKCK